MASTVVSPLSTRAADAALRLLGLVAEAGFLGPDPYDGLWHEWPGPLVGGRRRRQVFMQLHARTPVDFRILYRRRHPLIPKALGIFGSVALLLQDLPGHAEAARVHGGAALRLLHEDRTAGPEAWGYHWDMQTRWSFYPAGTPNVVVAAFAGQALREAGAAWEAPEWEKRARAAAAWTLRELLLDGEFFVYHPGSTVLIHNANLLAAVLVHETLGEADVLARPLVHTLAGQRPDGAWPYGEGANVGFVDNFHTGYVLECLSRLSELDPAIEDAVRRGTSHWVEHFFLDDGTATLWPDQRYPEDAHATGTALTTLSRLVRDGHADPELLERVCVYGLERMIRPDGHAVVRRYRLGSTRTTYLRWCDAHMALGLANAARALA